MSIKRNINYLTYRLLPLPLWLKWTYWYYHKKTLHIDNPSLFSEKLYIMKAWNKHLYPDLIQKCYDKFRVREYVKEVVGEKYLTHLHGLWNSPEEIDFSTLPRACVFKITQSSGFNVICLDREGKDDEIRTKLGIYLANQNNSAKTATDYTIEQYYFDQHAKIMCEELLMDAGRVPDDMRFLCFNGTVKYIVVDYESVSAEGEKLHDYCRNVYDRKGNFIPYEFGRMNNPGFSFPPMDNLDEMIHVAEKLSKPFRFVRVDLYNMKGRIVFGELTWIPQGGSGRIQPVEFDKELGNLLDFSGYNPADLQK